MPSPVRSRGKKKYYKRKGSPKGYAKHSVALDKKKKARKGTRKQVKRYPQAYD